MSMEPAKKLTIEQGKYTRETDECGAEMEELQQLLGKYMKQDAVAVIWQMQEIVWGRWTAGQFSLAGGKEMDASCILELRVFNAQEEMHVTRQKDSFIWRYICDEGEKTSHYVDSLARLWGRRTGGSDGYVVLEDRERKLQLTVPCAEQADFYGLVTRNYIQVNAKNGQAGYGDYRYKAITPAEGEK